MAKRSHHLSEIKIRVRRKDRQYDKPIGELKLEDLEFVLDPASLAALNADLSGAYRGVRNENLGHGIEAGKIRHTVQKDVVLTTAEALVPHALGVVPTYYHVVPKNAGVWYETRNPDSRYVYLKASTGSIIADVIIHG